MKVYAATISPHMYSYHLRARAVLVHTQYNEELAPSWLPADLA